MFGPDGDSGCRRVCLVLGLLRAVAQEMPPAFRRYWGKRVWINLCVQAVFLWCAQFCRIVTAQVVQFGTAVSATAFDFDFSYVGERWRTPQHSCRWKFYGRWSVVQTTAVACNGDAFVGLRIAAGVLFPRRVRMRLRCRPVRVSGISLFRRAISLARAVESGSLFFSLNYDWISCCLWRFLFKMRDSFGIKLRFSKRSGLRSTGAAQRLFQPPFRRYQVMIAGT